MSFRSTTRVFPFDLRITVLVCVAFFAIAALTVFGEDFRRLFGSSPWNTTMAETTGPVMTDYPLRHRKFQPFEH